MDAIETLLLFSRGLLEMIGRPSPEKQFRAQYIDMAFKEACISRK